MGLGLARGLEYSAYAPCLFLMLCAALRDDSCLAQLEASRQVSVCSQPGMTESRALPLLQMPLNKGAIKNVHFMVKMISDFH